MNNFRGLLLLVFLTACSGLSSTGISSPNVTPTSTLISIPGTPTATVVWFPPTNTATIIPTQTLHSTPQQRPGQGELVFSDSFDQPELWNTSTSALGSARVDRNRLILSISAQGPLSILSLRDQPLLADFYAETMVTLSLCGSQDQFGMVFRHAPGDNYYRFSIRCDGQIRVERAISGSNLPLRDWLASGDAPRAAPAQVKLGVWVAGSEMRFFLNDNFQFSMRDPILHEGALGFFVYANGTTPITVSFSGLEVYSVIYLAPTPSLTLSSTPVPTNTTVLTQAPTP